MMPIQHPLYENAFYLTRSESEFLYSLRDVNKLEIAKAMSIGDSHLHGKLSGRHPMTTDELSMFCMYARVTPREVFSADNFNYVDLTGQRDAA